ncbi:MULTISPECIES: DUF768 domain-containing protein [unclassified Mesorhizobium]|uniref:DUF768 domain-containing protein n=1 Tax=unclassified Mesorhizobium TaxID=325217 RepID=UPI00112907B8|nr:MULTISPECIES: DUF768 domain-containing protein [unclassified Mesorhizobium]MBZ9739915.1 DUF768 domain-containing protein [Mesorhizobium sp. CO1-1-4]MBZ9805728.1 DUF768 domain-containing protein [Mesorhizobium sp. ES1-6]TPL88582.1 DUF768 domain-containing protein [Mesorhizobium sp. B2-3-12]
MSTRGVNFLDKWLSSNVSGMASSDVLSVAEAIQKLFADGKAIGISSTEIEEETGSVYEAVSDAIVHHDAGLLD